MQARTLLELPAYPSGRIPAGTLIEHPQAVDLVRLGVAEPADEECTRAHGLMPGELETVRRAYRRTARGIAPEDFQNFDDGLMDGYDADGQPIPGPNFIPPEEPAEESPIWTP
jgi:hypothetical protein